ncbi:MAG: GNAT family N-acetyltransferase [Balneolaceae bacterium]
MAESEDTYLIKTDRLNLRPIRKSDLEFIYMGLSDPKVNMFYGIKLESITEAHEQLQWYQNLLDENSGIWWKLTHNETGLSIGACGYNNWDHSENTAEIGLWLLPEYWGKGLMKEAAEAGIKHGFEKMGLERIIAEVETENASSISLLKNLGFTKYPDKTFSDVKGDKLISVEVYELTRN